MNRPSNSFHRLARGFTLIELLTVISIIGILAAMIVPAVTKTKEKAQVAMAKKDIQVIIGAINSYNSTYSRMPASKDAQSSINDTCPDFTWGTVSRPGSPTATLVNRSGIALPGLGNTGTTGNKQANNSELVAILRDWAVYRDGVKTVNPNDSLNPQKQDFLDGFKDVNFPRMPGGGTPMYRPNGTGIGPDGVLRDPWGNPYIISLDLNYDNHCRDAYYRLDAVSRDLSGGVDLGLNGLRRASPVGSGDTGSDRFEANTAVMVWSFGPDGTIGKGAGASYNPVARANEDHNKDNILSWK